MENQVKFFLEKNKLSFTPELEKKFNSDYFQRVLPIVRIALVMAFILYSAFGVLDVFISPDTKYFTWFVRYLIICPVIATVFIISFYKIFIRVMQITVSVVSIAAGFGIISMIVTASSIQGSLYYYAGLNLIIMWSYTFVRLKFINASIVCTLIILAYEISIIFFWEIFSSKELLIAFVNNNFFIISSNIIGMFVCYHMEIYMRRDFLQRMLIEIHEKRSEEEKKMLITLSVTDPLTSAYNRRYFINALDIEISRANRYKTVFSLIMLDIDHFKDVNDNYGHDAGDEVLKGLAGMMNNGIRKSDVFARWGGEEFMILLSGTDIDNAKVIADKLLSEVRDLVFIKTGKITASFGVTEYILEESLDSILKRVDELVYKAKNDGRNCIRLQ